MVDLNDFQREIQCKHKDENYCVRDNGAVFKIAPNINKPRPTDNKWTFGKLNMNTGYLEIASVRIHRIVATAFHGEPETKEHVVDHIDTNKQNNRPENLRWVTRLENILLNPITVKRIELTCGSIEAFLENPAKFRNKFSEPNYEWMCTVTIEEAQKSKERLLAWASIGKKSNGNSLGQWIFNRTERIEEPKQNDDLIDSLTPNAKQRNWKTPTKFPCCPFNFDKNSLFTYFENLKNELIFSENQFGKSIIRNFSFSKDNMSIWIMCQSNDLKSIKPFSLAEVTFEKDKFVHTNQGGFFTEDGAEKQFTLAIGIEWTKGETFDELCG